MLFTSLDPRVSRLGISPESETFSPMQELDNFETYEVFHQTKPGDRHVHVGSVHAANHEMAFLYAKEQYCRRGKTNNIWVVRTSDVIVLPDEDSDMFESTPEKLHREAGFYKVRDKIENFKKESKS